MMRLIFSVIFAFSLPLLTGSLTAQNKFLIINEFDIKNTPEKPNYGENQCWAALPTMKDMADEIPKSKLGLKDNQTEAIADVFFIYPTIYTFKPENQYTWNASIEDFELNKKIDNSTIKNQASVFNGSCKIYAPRYRQAHYSVFLTSDSLSAKQAMELAYADVKAAFEYYLKHYNQGRPIIIAGHSQGTLHAVRILNDFFDNKPLQAKLISAYLIGMPINDGMFSKIKLAEGAGAIGGYISWNTFANNFYPDYYQNGLHKSQVIHPITWTSDVNFSEYKQHKGTLGPKFKILPNIVSAKSHAGLLWIRKPKVFGKAFLKTKIWHFADYNLFWIDIRENLTLQVQNFIEKHGLK
ncbi:MAG TPA: DUF3089 domain-containing protein [Leadbetterella sp.]|nr:DUF3089 domain-containing protein [Leadbetterella sp.]